MWSVPERLRQAVVEARPNAQPELFGQRAEFALQAEPTPSHRRALQALPAGGTVLDVGAGAGAASLPLGRRASLVVAVDRSDSMLQELRRCAKRAGVAVIAVAGSWPQVAPDVEATDVVVCHHVLYQITDLPPFVRALTSHARRRVIVEMTTRHPQAWMADLWLRFHGLRRPMAPTADEAELALREMGLPVSREDHLLEMPPAGFERREQAIAEVCQRLYLQQERIVEVEAALGGRLTTRRGLWSAFPQFEQVTTLWWDATGCPAEPNAGER